MRKFLTRLTALSLLLSVLFLFLPVISIRAEAASSRYTNPDTGYQIIIEDDAGLLTTREKEELADLMAPVTAYGNAAFKTIDYNHYTSESFAKSYYEELFGTDSGALFLIDMDNRNIWIRCHGRISKIVTDRYTDIITDNCYRKASEGDYFGCAERAFQEITALLEGSRIAQPMKYISNALLALTLAFLINYFIVRITSRNSSKQTIRLEGIRQDFHLSNTRAEFLNTTVELIESSSGGGGSGGSGGGGGGGGGGGSSGGHSF